MHQLIAIVGVDIIALSFIYPSIILSDIYQAPTTCQAQFYEIVLVTSLLYTLKSLL